MMKPDGLITLGLGAFVLMAVLAGLALLMGTNEAAPGCTGPAVARCDYVETAKAAVAKSDHHPFRDDGAFEVFDQGTSVRVQQPAPPGALSHGPSVLIDRKSCRACQVEYRSPVSDDPRSKSPGRLIQRIPAEPPA